MTHSYRINYFHLIWSTKNRLPQITPEIQSRLYPYIGSIVKSHSGKILEIGGMSDHIHLLVEITNIDKFSNFFRDVKASSSLWVHKNFKNSLDFAWQEGYASYSVSYSLLEQVKNYIQNQEKHHKQMSFNEEYLKFLQHHKIIWDDRFVLG